MAENVPVHRYREFRFGTEVQSTLLFGLVKIFVFCFLFVFGIVF